MLRHYIYRLEDKTTGEFYWGVRTCRCDPKDDKYMGSMLRWKPNKENLIKTTIIEYENRQQAAKAEEIVISFYIDKNKFPLNRNYAVGHFFERSYTSLSIEQKLKMSKALKGKPKSDTMKRKVSESLKTSIKFKEYVSKEKPKRSEESRKKTSESLKGRQVSEETRKKISAANKNHIPWNKGKTKQTNK